MWYEIFNFFDKFFLIICTPVHYYFIFILLLLFVWVCFWIKFLNDKWWINSNLYFNALMIWKWLKERNKLKILNKLSNIGLNIVLYSIPLSLLYSLIWLVLW